MITFVPTIFFRIFSLFGFHIIILVFRSLFLCEVALLYSLVFFGGLGILFQVGVKAGSPGFCFGVFIACTLISYSPFPSPGILGIIIYMGACMFQETYGYP